MASAVAAAAFADAYALVKLLAQRGNRRGQLLDLRACRSAHLLLAGKRLLGLLGAPRECLALALFGLELGGEAGGAGPQIRAGSPLESQQIAQLADLLLQFLECLVAPGQRIGEEELAGGENQKDKDDHHQELRQGVDEARPDVDAGAPRAAAG